MGGKRYVALVLCMLCCLLLLWMWRLLWVNGARGVLRAGLVLQLHLQLHVLQPCEERLGYQGVVELCVLHVLR